MTKKKKALGLDGKKTDREVRGYTLKASEEVEFCYNVFKHYFENVQG